MPCIIDYKTYSNIIIRDFRNVVTTDCLIYSWNYMIDNNLITNNTKGVISDFRESEVKFSLCDIDKLTRHYKKNFGFINTLKLAQVVDSPDIVYAILFKESNTDYVSRAFSTLNAAKKWIDNGL